MSSMSRGSLSTGQGSPRSSSPPGDEGQHSPSASSSLRHRAPSPSPTTKKAKQSVNDQLGLPSPRDFRHKQRRQSDGECMLMQQPESITNLHHVHSSIPLNIFECGNEVKELVAVGDKVWTADRRSAKVSIRCTKTGEIEKQLKPPTRDENDNKKQDKEHIFPWSIIHVRFLKSRSPFRFDNIDQTTSDDEEDVVAQRFNQSSSLLRDTPSPSPGGMGKTSFSSIPGGVLDPEYKSESRSTRKRAAPRRSSSSSRHPPPLKTVGSMTSLMSGRNHNVSNMNESSAMHTVPATGDKLTKDQYVDEVWVGYSNGCIRAFDATSGKYLFEMIEQGGIYCMTSWGDYVYSGSNDWTIRKWDAAKRVCVGQFLPGDQGHSNSVRALCIAEEYLVSASDDFTLRLWDHMSVGQDAYNTTGRCLRVLHGHKASVLTLAYCDGRLWSGSEDATVMVWDLKGDKPQLLRQLSDTRHVVTKLVPLPDIHRVLCCSVDNVLRVYNTKKLELEQELDGHTGFIHSCAAVATVLRYVVWSSSQDGTLRFWSIAGDDKPQSCSKFVTDSDPSNELGRVRFRLNESEAREALLAKSLQDLQDRNNRLQGDHDRSASRLAALEAENEKKDEDIAHLKHLLEQERQKAGQSLSSNKEAVSDLQRELDKRQQEAERLQRLLDKMEKDTARTEEEKQRKYDDVVDGLKKQLDQLRQDLQDARDDQSGGRRKQNDLENERKRLLAENRDRDGVERSLRKELEDALQQLENEKDQRRHLESKMRGRMEENKGMAKLGEEARDALKHERDLLAEELSRVQGDDLQSREALQRKSAIAAFHEANAFMLHNRAHAAEKRCMQLENMQSRVIDANAQIKTANAELYKLRKSNETLMDENEAWQRTVEGLKNDLRDALQRLRTTQNELEDLKEENGLLLKDKEGGKKRVTMAEDDAKNARNRLRDEVADLESRLHKLTDENERLDQKLRRLGTLEADHVTQAEENQILRDQIQDLLTQLHKLRGCEKEGKEALSELESLKDELERVMAERDNLRNRGEEVKSLRAELANQKGRVNRTEEVLNHLRSQKNDLDELVKKLREDLETARNELDERDSSDRNLRLQMELNKMQGDANNHYQFIMQSRTDFIQAVYDWLLCSAMARRHMKRFDLNSQESLETLQQAVEGAYKRGHYILSNYVSELEKVHTPPHLFVFLTFFVNFRGQQQGHLHPILCLFDVHEQPSTAPPWSIAYTVPTGPDLAGDVYFSEKRVCELPEG